MVAPYGRGWIDSQIPNKADSADTQATRVRPLVMQEIGTDIYPLKSGECT
jgi:hypothetical protein